MRASSETCLDLFGGGVPIVADQPELKALMWPCNDTGVHQVRAPPPATSHMCLYLLLAELDFPAMGPWHSDLNAFGGVGKIYGHRRLLVSRHFGGRDQDSLAYAVLTMTHEPFIESHSTALHAHRPHTEHVIC